MNGYIYAFAAPGNSVSNICWSFSPATAPDVETLIERFVRDRCRDQQTDLRSMVEAQIARVTIEANSISVELSGSSDSPPSSPAQIVSLPWSKKPFRVAKGVVAEPAAPEALLESYPKSKEAVLAAIRKARRWVDQLMAGASLSDIASQEGKTPRHIRLLTPLAFVSPATAEELINGTRTGTITDLASRVPLAW